MNFFTLLHLILTFLLGTIALGENDVELEIFREHNLDNKHSRLLFRKTFWATD